MRWYTRQFVEVKRDWFVFPGGSRFPKDPTKPIGSLKTVWNNVRKKAGATGRGHDNRHTFITELAESGTGDETIMEHRGSCLATDAVALCAHSYRSQAEGAG